MSSVSILWQLRRKAIQRFKTAVGMLWVVALGGMLCLLSSSATYGADSTYQCIPSGFSIGIPPFQAPYDAGAGAYGLSVPGFVSYGAMRERLGEQLHKSSLFSGITLGGDSEYPDSTDLTLLVSFPTIRQESEGPPATYQLVVSVVLVENVGGNALFDKSYERTYEAQYASTLLVSERFNADIQVAFAGVIPDIIIDLNRVLNQSTDPVFLDLAEAKTVTHAHLESLWILPTIALGKAPGIAQYGRFIREHLKDRLSRKNCFTVVPLSDTVRQCAADAGATELQQVVDALRRCAMGRALERGMLLVTFLSPEEPYSKVRCVLLLLPDFKVLYDRSVTAPTGWRLGNALEELAAGIAQASHSVPH